MKVTIADVAKRAGVSMTTVSRVMNGQYQFMSAKTRERVEEVIQELGYIPNSMAQGLKNQRTKLIGVLISNISHPYWPDILEGIEETCRQYGYSVLFCNAHDDPSLELHYLSVLQNKQVDGIIINPTGSNQEKLIQLIGQGCPMIALDRKLDHPGIPFAGVDNIAGAQLATEYLLSLGHRRIGIVTYQLNGLSNREDRLKGYRETLRKAGIRIDENLAVYVNPGDNRNSHTTIREMLLSQRPTAVLSANLLLNLEILAAIRVCGLHIPRDISVVGYDEAIWMPYIEPPLTTISQPACELGVVTATKLVEQVEGGMKELESVQLKPKLIIRESCRRVERNEIRVGRH